MRTKFQPINALASTRARLGLTQEQMAMQLGLSGSMVKMVETNRRFLSSGSLVKLAALEIRLAAIPQSSKAVLPPCVKELYANANDGYALQASCHAEHCISRATQQEKKLKKMQREHDQLLASLHNLDAMLTLDLDMSDPVMGNLLVMRPRLLQKLTRCNPQEQAKMKQKIALLYAEASLNKSIHPRYVHTNEKPILSPLKQSNMDYTVSQIGSRADCQAMIDRANDDKATLAYRKTGLQLQLQNVSTTSVSIETDLAAVTAELAVLQTVLDTLPEGDYKAETRVKFKKAEYRKFLLEQRKTNYGSVALVEKEFDIACIENSLAESDALVLALTNRMNELPPA